MKVEINPDGFAAEYLDSLNLAFDGWGDQDAYDWVFDRTCGSHPADQIVLRDDDSGDAIAGSGVSYRQVDGPSDTFSVGIMTGSWTLPAARGQGCFARIIEESRALCRKRGFPYLVAFVTHDNASRRRLEAAGSVMVPSRYIFTGEGEVDSPLVASGVELDADALWCAVVADREGSWHFAYPALSDFVGQCVERAHPTACLAVGDARVIIEQTDTADRVVVASYGSEAPTEVLAAVARRAHSNGRRFFAFAIGESQVQGLDDKAGFFTIIGADDAAEPDLRDLFNWRIDAGDRM